MSNLLKEAIADAKAVRETALENAKAALEEAFTPRLQSMLSKKLKEDEFGDEEEGEEGEYAEGEDEEKPIDIEPEDEGPESGDEGEAEIPSDEGGEEAYDDGEDVGDGEDVAGDVAVEPESEEEDGLDIEAIVKELEAEEDGEFGDEEEGFGDEEEDGEVEETIELNGQKYSLVREEEDAEEDEEVTEETDQSSGVGSGGESGYEEDDFDDDAKPLSISEDEETEEDEEMDEIVDLSSLLNSLREDDTDEDEEPTEEVVNLQKELKEHRKVIGFMRNKLNEVNLLNAKLLFTNKLFKTYNLNNKQKLHVVETFDRAKNSREIKLIYTTLAESFSGRTSGSPVAKINEAFAGKKSGSTKPKRKVISEGSDLAKRFKKLAGIV